MANPQLAGFVLNSAGAGVDGVTINVYSEADTATITATTTTAADGGWTIANSSVTDPDIAVVNGTETFRIKYGDEVALTRMDAQTYVLRNSSATDSFQVVIQNDTLLADYTYKFYEGEDQYDTSTSGIIATSRLFHTQASSVGSGSHKLHHRIPFTFYKTGVTSSVTSTTAVADSAMKLHDTVAATLFLFNGWVNANWNNSVSTPVFNFSAPGVGAQVDGVAWWNDTNGANVTQFDETTSIAVVSTDASGAVVFNYEGRLLFNGSDTFAIYMRQSSANASATRIQYGQTTYKRITSSDFSI